MANGGDITYIINVNGSGAVNGANQVSRALENLQQVGKKLMGMGAAMSAAITLPLVAAGKAGISFNSAMETANTNFATMLGSAERAKTMVSDLQKFANNTPFEMKGLTDAAQTLLAFGMSADNVMPSIKMLGDASMGNSEKFKSLTLAFAQVQSTGRLMGQDLLQMVNAGFNPLQIISEKTGISMKELKEKMEKGAISADMVTKAFQIATSEGGRYYKAMNNASKTFDGQMSTLKDTVKTTLGVVTKPLFEELTNRVIPALTRQLKNLQDWFSGLNPAIQKVILVVLMLIAAFGPFLVICAGVIKMIAIMRTVITGLSAAFTFLTGPVGLAIAAILVIIAVAALFIRSWTPVSKFFIALWETIKTTFVLGGGYITKTLQTVGYQVTRFLNFTVGNALKGISTLLGAMSKIPLIGDTMGDASDAVNDAVKSMQALENGAKAGLGGTDAAMKSLKDQLKKNLGEVSDTAAAVGDSFIADITGMITGAKSKVNGLMGDSKMNADLKKTDDLLKGMKFNFDELKGSGTSSAKEIADAFKNVSKEIKDQTGSFSNFVGLFDKVQRSGTGSGESLTNRLRKQVEEMKKWSEGLNTIQAKLGPGNEDLMDELRKLGPGNARQIIGLSRLNSDQLKEYANLYGQKQDIAWQQAKQVVKYEHSGTIIVRGVDQAGETKEIAQIVASDLAANKDRYSKNPSANKAFK